MAIERRFLIASSLARLIQREHQTTNRIVEGHFPQQPDRYQHVRVEHGRAMLILAMRDEDGRMVEEQAEIPLAHAEALLDVGAGTTAYDRIELPLGDHRTAVFNHFLLPQGLDVIALPAGAGEMARDFWAGWMSGVSA